MIRQPQDDQVSAAAAVLKEAGVADADTARYTPLSGGTYNTVVRVAFDDHRQWVVKIPPPLETPGLGHERELLRGEVAFYTSAATAADIPVPEVVHGELDPHAAGGPYLISTLRPGTPWHEISGTIADDERRRLREELGRLVARLHTVAGTGFGYPAEPFGPPAATWRQAFTTMMGAVLDDAERYRARLPVPPDRVRGLFAAAADVLDDVIVPVLVHFDLWEGNLLLDGEAGARTISGVIDGERMFWGDPVADFVSLALLGNVEDDADFLAGYAAVAGPPRFDDSVRLRLALYRAYLYLIMLVEGVPRGYSPEQWDGTRRNVTPQLLKALGEVESACR
ncbi:MULTISPECIES: aminoglycoside phosphotransferase family protein [unclassified Streptomyces]|uniref:phosphotransferase family protein n=1 Tax=unclassified Streptomyces TaxID=2593676 RepID=UPI00336AB2C2